MASPLSLTYIANPISATVPKEQKDRISTLPNVLLGLFATYLTLQENLESRSVSRRFHQPKETNAKLEQRISYADFISPRHALRILKVAKIAGLQIKSINFQDFPFRTHLNELNAIFELWPQLKLRNGLNVYCHEYGESLEDSRRELDARKKAGIILTGLSLQGAGEELSGISAAKVYQFLALCLNPELTYLNLAECTCDDQCLEMIGQRAPKLEGLRLGGSYCDPSSVTERNLISLFSNLPHLKSLTNYGLNIPITKNILFSIARSCTKLEEVTFHKDELDESGLRSILEQCPSLKRVTVSRCKNVSKETIANWKMRWPNLEVVVQFFDC